MTDKTALSMISLIPTRRDRRAADAALRAHLRRRDRIDRFALTPIPAPRSGFVGRVLASVVPRV